MDQPRAFIGARPEKMAKLPPEWIELYRQAAVLTAMQEHTIHTGAAPGADQIAAEAALQAGGSVVLFLPWRSFEAAWIETLRPHRGRVSVCIYDPEQHAQWAAWVDQHHPNPRVLGRAARKLMARNGGIIGSGAVEVVALPLWEGDRAGGTGYGMTLAGARGIPLWDLSQEPARAEWERRLTS